MSPFFSGLSANTCVFTVETVYLTGGERAFSENLLKLFSENGVKLSLFFHVSKKKVFYFRHTLFIIPVFELLPTIVYVLPVPVAP